MYVQSSIENVNVARQKHKHKQLRQINIFWVSFQFGVGCCFCYYIFNTDYNHENKWKSSYKRIHLRTMERE